VIKSAKDRLRCNDAEALNRLMVNSTLESASTGFPLRPNEQTLSQTAKASGAALGAFFIIVAIGCGFAGSRLKSQPRRG
jgi:hypothetical protein